MPKMHVATTNSWRTLCGIARPFFAYRIGTTPVHREYAPPCKTCERIADARLAAQAAKRKR